jgi:receptor protein-tyrosine kinase
MMERHRRHRGHGDDTESVRNAIRVLRERWWIVALVVLGCTALAFVRASTQDEVYQSTARVLFGQTQLSDAAFGINRDSLQPERQTATQVVVATSSEVTDRAQLALSAAKPVGDPTSAVSVEAAENADVLAFTARAVTPRDAAAIANAHADSYVDFSRQSEVQQLDAQIRAISGQLELVREGDDRAALEQRIGTLRSLRSAATGQARLIGAAEVPTAPTSPRPLRDGILGGILGLTMGVACIFVVDLFDRRVRSIEQFEHLYEMGSLAAIPKSAFGGGRRRPSTADLEPYRMLRNSLRFVELTETIDALMVTSAVPFEGKSTVALNLARAMALTGERVVLVECDLRQPSLARRAGIPAPAAGLTTCLMRQKPAAELLTIIDRDMPSLLFLASGPLPPNPAELLSSARMADVLADLKAGGARVILDTPPLLPVADAQGLLDHPQIDAALLVARTTHATHDDCRRTRAVLDRHRLQPLGLVVTGVDRHDSYGPYGVDSGSPVPATTTHADAAGARHEGGVGPR